MNVSSKRETFCIKFDFTVTGISVHGPMKQFIPHENAVSIVLTSFKIHAHTQRIQDVSTGLDREYLTFLCKIDLYFTERTQKAVFSQMVELRVKNTTFGIHEWKKNPILTERAKFSVSFMLSILACLFQCLSHFDKDTISFLIVLRQIGFVQWL